MGQSFFNGSTDSNLYVGSKNFSLRINTEWAALGLKHDMAIQYAALDAQWQAAFMATRDPSTRTSGKVAEKNQLRRELVQMASTLGRLISGNPSVSSEKLIELGLSVRAASSPIGFPGIPTQFHAMLGGDGAFTLLWKCENPAGARGTQYEIWRQIKGGTFEFITITGKKRYRDITVPIGAPGINYKIRAVRSTRAGDWAIFGISIGGGMPDFLQRQAA